MIHWLATLIAALLALGGLCSPTISWAKPPDLPGGVLQQCPEGRERQQEESFAERPETSEPRTLLLHDVERARSNRAVVDRGVEAGEEQESPPERMQMRPQSERRRGVSVPPERNRERTGPVADDPRRSEMLRTTEPLDTQPQRPMEECEVLREKEVEPVR